jgi:hypothetical protein
MISFSQLFNLINYEDLPELDKIDTIRFNFGSC